MDTTANIANVDMGRTVQRVPPFPRPTPLTPYDQVEQLCGGSKFDGEVEEKEADEIVEGRRTSEESRGEKEVGGGVRERERKAR